MNTFLPTALTGLGLPPKRILLHPASAALREYAALQHHRSSGASVKTADSKCSQVCSHPRYTAFLRLFSFGAFFTPHSACGNPADTLLVARTARSIA